ncbi:MAG: putative esterase [Gemmatimonadetes bacterium]|nr:putative esterase [Gemmatimonadota bacterium]
MLLLPLLLVGAWLGVMRVRAARIEAASRARLAGAPSGIVPGAESIELPGDAGRAILLLHGGGDTPQTLQELARALHARGFAVHAPLLPAHGRTVRDFARADSRELLQGARDAYVALRARHEWVGVIGLSMGGALAVRLAAEHPELPALGLAAPYLVVPPIVRRLARTAPLWGWAVPYLRGRQRGQSIQDESQRAGSLAYGIFTPAFLRALTETVDAAWEALPRVTSPTLVLQSREDNRITPASAAAAFERLGAPVKELAWLSGMGHVITVDRGREQVFARLGEWMERYESAPASHEESRGATTA